MKARHKRLAFIVVGVTGLSAASLFLLNAFRSNLVYFYSPTEVHEGKAPIGELFRIGGLVEQGSVKKSSDGLKVEFVVTEYKYKYAKTATGRGLACIIAGPGGAAHPAALEAAARRR